MMVVMLMADRILLRRDTSANWQVANPVLAQGEFGLDLDLMKVKCGDGITAWNDLDYCSPSQAEFDFLQDEINAHMADYATHMAENVSHLIEVVRDVSISGVQTISLPFKPKSLICRASIELQKAFSIGFWAENNTQFVNSICLDILETFKYAKFIYLRNTSGYILAEIQNVTETGFEINWGVSTGITGIATLFILASTH